MSFHARPDETAEWLNYLQPEGLVVGANVLRAKALTPIRQTPQDTEAVAEALGLPSDAEREHDKSFVLADHWRFLAEVLHWPASHVAGAPGGPAVSDSLARTAPEHETLLAPDMALLWTGAPEQDGAKQDLPAQALVLLHPTLDPDGRNQLPGEWEASPHQRLERLLRETGVGVGLLVARNTLRLVYAPRGETAGWLSWPLAALGRVEGRPMLAGLKLCLNRNAFFTGAAETRLRALLQASREAQNEVSAALSGQVLGALHELMRGLHRAAPERIEALAADEPHHLYEGLLTCLMRLVFLLYAEDRDLLPSSANPQLRALWESGYSVKTLYARLLADDALNPDTMDQRRGGWGQLLAVFRLVHDGHPEWVARRGGKLFDPDAFAFLEGRAAGSLRAAGQVLEVSDGTILRILHGLMTVEGRGLSGEKIRERLSYRSLDVESIGSVYETVMGFTACRATETMIALKDEKKLPAFVGLDGLLAQKPADRQKWLKEQSVSLSAKQAKSVKEATSVAALLEAFGGAIDLRASPDGPIGAGTPYLQPTAERRRSGSHYTPRSLTEPIVRHALEPAFERIGAAASPEAVLALKVLDPACGSGAFLVEACRQLGTRLEQAWDMHTGEKPPIPPDEDEATHARRLVAQRCLYGVDRNPMAVDLARLSLWLATLACDHEFSFLDHALKSGDSLVGLTTAEIKAAHWDASKPGLPLFRKMIEDAVGRALLGREAIRNAPDDVSLAMQSAKHRRVEDEVEPARMVGDAIIAAFFSADKPKEREKARAEVESWITGSFGVEWERVHAKARAFRAAHGWRPFHWEIEYPEVFARENPGFDAVVGNPPFLGGGRISTVHGSAYLEWLQSLHKRSHGNADIVAHFYRRAFSILRQNGMFAFIASNSIKQGDTRESGLRAIICSGGSIARATTRYKWQGSANVVTSFAHILKGNCVLPVLDGRSVKRISAYLVEGNLDDTPNPLHTNKRKAFQGSKIYGQGFTFDDDGFAKGETEGLAKMHSLLNDGPSLAERILPYIGGEEVNNDPLLKHRRYVIDFQDFPLCRRDLFSSWYESSDGNKRDWLRVGIVPRDYPAAVAEDWPELLHIVESRVKPERIAQNREARKIRWWRFGDRQAGLYLAVAPFKEILVTNCGASPHLAFGRLSSKMIYAHSLTVIAFGAFAPLSVLQSRVHEVWARFFSSSMKDDLRYAPSDCFETFPFPPGYETDPTLEAAGHVYHDHRAALMIAANEGMTKTYNRFHKAEERGAAIQTLRELHNAMDQAALRAYGWDDLADTLRPVFLTPETEDDHTYQTRYFWPAEGRDQVLARLLALNAQRHAEEVAAGTAPKTRGKANGEEAEAESEDLLDG